MDIPLGSQVEDSVTGFKGTVICRTLYLNGCVQYGVAPRVGSDGKIVDSMYFDEERLVVISAATPADKPLTGGPQSLVPPQTYRG